MLLYSFSHSSFKKEVIIYHFKQRLGTHMFQEESSLFQVLEI
ncbi:hypothetical protein BMETH_1037_0 [methanotrophic bacterial endosymbiont of Bathymodiolus sp.]|nr:hypothetical protein BMETH_1037_0 [methanotrophic bacterial endosymbiont of Bathymodiolus sp.]